jgi:hypothetical protein
LRGLSLTPPRRGLSLMPRASIVYVGRRRMAMGIGGSALELPLYVLRRCRGSGQQQAPRRWAMGLGKMAWPTSFPREVFRTRKRSSPAIVLL